MVQPPPKPPVICHDLAEKSRLARQRHSVMEDELDKLRVDIHSLKQKQDKILQSHGLSHSAAYYIQKLEDRIRKMENDIQRLCGENERLRQKNDQILASRKHVEIEYRQHLRECQQLNKVPSVSSSTPIQPRANKFSMPPQMQRNNSQGSSSTVSITSSGSSIRKSPPSLPLSPIDDGTLEISALPFFEKMEDETMLNVNNLMNRMKSTVEDLNPDDRPLKRTGQVSSQSLDLIMEHKSVPIDPVDEYLSKQTGLIRLPPEKTSCKHRGKERCINCLPIQPFDKAYLTEHKIKHMSFHAYLRKLTQGVNKGKFAPLENISCRIKAGCPGHKPWPEGICTKCQPSAITLNQQEYRHVDNITFENPSVVDNFLDYWRRSGCQRYGLLFGDYTSHDGVPLGIKANVVAIYEPPQRNSPDHIEILDDPNYETVKEIAKDMGLVCVGWIFTDLIAKDTQRGLVEHTRGAESYFLSAHECIQAGRFQNDHPNPCQFSFDGYFGSKFGTVCVTGDKDNKIHMEGYQVSNQCMALVRDNCMIPTKDAPELGYIKKSSADQYVPDVYYKLVDEYKNEKTQLARPLPIEYLLVDVPVSAPMTPTRTFNHLLDKKPFSIENREELDFSNLQTYLSQFELDSQFKEAICDFHLLVYLRHQEIVPMGEAIRPLTKAIGARDAVQIINWRECEQWRTIEQLTT